MTQKVLRVGSSAAVTIPKHSLKDLGLKPGDDVHVAVDRKRKTVTITPDKKITNVNARIAKITFDFIERYRKDLEALADK